MMTILLKTDSTNVTYIAALGRAAALSGDTHTALMNAAALATGQSARTMSARTLGRAEIASAMGNNVGAIALLESIPYRLHPTDFLLLHSNAGLAALHDQPRFKAFIRPKG
jgi:hypothetical protein